MAQLEDALFTDGDASGDGWADSQDWYFMPSLGMNLQQVWILADLNGDMAVDELDTDRITENLGMSNPTWADGDLNSDGSINFRDLDLAYAQYGLELAAVA
jgi:hypothetical protein